MTEIRLVPTTVHGRYLLRQGEWGLIVGFHGYAENADIHLAHMERIPGVTGWRVAAVQALHPFYTRNDAQVVANWMTRLDRDQTIADNIEYIRRVVNELGNPRPLVFLGFSQGASMAYRAAAHLRCDGLITLGGDVPPDVSAQESVQIPPTLAGRGARDEWFTSEKFEKDLRFLTSVTDVTTCVFEGGHEWTDEFRQAAGRFLERMKDEG